MKIYEVIITMILFALLITIVLAIETAFVYLLWCFVRWGFPSTAEPQWIQAFVIAIVFTIVNGSFLKLRSN